MRKLARRAFVPAALLGSPAAATLLAGCGTLLGIDDYEVGPSTAVAGTGGGQGLVGSNVAEARPGSASAVPLSRASTPMPASSPPSSDRTNASTGAGGSTSSVGSDGIGGGGNVPAPVAPRVDWIREFAGTARDVSVDSSGNILVTVSVNVISGADSFEGANTVVRKLDASGNQLWTRQLTTNSEGYGAGVSVDADGNVFVAGDAELGSNGFLRKLDASGVELWSRLFSTGAAMAGGGATAVSPDPDGNVLVVGSTGEAPPEADASDDVDAFVRKHDTTGAELWSRRFGPSGAEASTYAEDVSADGSGNVLVVGSTGGALPGQDSLGYSDAFVRKYDAAGTEVWTRQFGTSEPDWGDSVGVDSAGNVFIAGSTTASLIGPDDQAIRHAFVRKYDASGNPLWTQEFSIAAVGTVELALDSSGSVVVAAQVGQIIDGDVSAGITDLLLRKYDAAGDPLWTTLFGSQTQEQSWEECFGLSIDGNGDLLVAGYTAYGLLAEEGGPGGAFVVKLSD